MIERLIDWSARNRLLVGIVTAMVAAGATWAALGTPVDALPDLSDVQVIVRTEYAGQGPQTVEEQVTYPLSTALLAVPYAETVRGYSMFGVSFVYVIFEDGTDLYWARSRVLEYLAQVQGRLPEGAQPALGPDATGVGWVYQYSLRDTTGAHDLGDLRAIQDFFLKYELQAVEGVAEVATIGGFERQYQVVVDPQRLAAYAVSIGEVRDAIARSNRDVGGRLLEMGEREYVVRGRGYLRGVEDIQAVVVRADAGTAVTVGQIAQVTVGPELRRGIAESNGEGEVVGGIVVMRQGANAQRVIAAVKERMEELRASLPAGVAVETEYDRSGLIQATIGTLTEAITQELLVVALIVVVFLLHLRSSFVALITLPIGILIALAGMRLIGVNANVMSLGGIAIAIGVMVDAAMVMVENAHKHLERLRGPDGLVPESERAGAVIAAAKEVGPSLFFSLLIVTVSFLPVFALGDVEGRLFRPLAFTKTFAMAAASVLAVTLVPALMVTFVRGRIRSEAENPVSRFFLRIYRPLLRGVLRRPQPVLVVGFALLVLSVLPLQRALFGRAYVPFPQLGSEFIPPFWEGDLLYMPTTLPGIGPGAAADLLQRTDRLIASFPEVERVFGKIGQAETATDPAPMSMIETVVVLRPESEWRPGVTRDSLVRALDAAVRFPGLTNAWTQPIRTRNDMLATGIKTPVGIKISGADLATLDRIGLQVEAALRPLAGTRSVIAERALGGQFLDMEVDRLAAARYGLTSGDVQEAFAAAVGGVEATRTVEGLERYGVLVRYPRSLRSDLPALRQVLVATPSGAQVPLGAIAAFRFAQGPSMIKSENARPNVWVYVDLEEGADVGSYVQAARRVVADRVEMPPGYGLQWSGQYEYMERANARLAVLIPVALAVIFLLYFLHLRDWREVAMLMVPLPFAVVGAVWFLLILGYNMSVAVAVGMIAVAGVAAETGLVMHVYLDGALKRYRREGRLVGRAGLHAALEEGAVDRLRPKLMTVLTDIIGLMPVMLGVGLGSEVMKRIAAPVVGGLLTSTVHTLIMIPALYAVIHGRRLTRAAPVPSGDGRAGAPVSPQASTEADGIPNPTVPPST
jgi:Cu(I)/Ag(I) efflux system membrane protein CusA/SilA